MTALLWRAARSWWVRLALSVAILAYLANRIDMTASARAVLNVDPWWLTLVLGLVAIDRLVMIKRFVLLLSASGLQVATRVAARLFLVSSFVGSFLPAGVGADAARAWGLKRHTSRGSDSLASVVVDRLLGVLSLAALALVGLLLWVPPGGRDWRLVAGAAALVVAGAAAFWGDRVIQRVVPAAWKTHPLVTRLFLFAEAVARFRGRERTLAVVLAWSLAVQLLRIVQAYGLAQGLGIVVPLAYYLLFMPVGLLMLLLPLSVSGVGLPQGVIVWLLRPMGVPDEQSFALSTLIILTGLAGNLPGLLLWLQPPAQRGTDRA